MMINMNHPQNPDSSQLTGLWLAAMAGDQLAQSQYFACLAVAKNTDVSRHMHVIRVRLLRRREGF